MGTYTIGDAELTVVTHGRGTGTGAWMFPSIDPGERETALRTHVDHEGLIGFVFSSAIVRMPDDIVLIDAGFAAEDADQPAVVAALNELGIAADDVSVVVITHGHHDHVGGLVDRRGDVTFGRAIHHLGRDELAHLAATEPAGSVARVAGAGLVEVIDGAYMVAGGVRVLPAPGHTPGHVAVEVESRGERALLAGDAIAHEVNIAQPDWNHFSDMVDSPTDGSRRALVTRAAEGNHIVIASHMTTVGRVTMTPTGGVLTAVPPHAIAA